MLWRRTPASSFLLLSVAALALAAWLGWHNGLGKFDHAVHDAFAQLAPPAASPDIVIVAVDDRSLAEVGRWPWPRSTHADLIERIMAQSPAALGLDLLLSEPSGDDAILAQAMARSGRIVLPVYNVRIPGREVEAMLPVPRLEQAARALGHVSIEIDSDGLVRSVFLREGQGGRWWEHFAVQLLRTAERPPPAPLPGLRTDAAPRGAWQRDHWMQIAFSGPAGSYRWVPAADVLAGEVPDDVFRGRIVMLGSTASGLGDVYPTPLSGQGVFTPGVEVSANVVDNLMNGHYRVRVQPWQSALFAMLVVGCLLPGLWLLSPLMAALSSLGVMLSALLASLVLLQFAGHWLPPGAPLFVGAIIYLLWNWRRLERAASFLSAETGRMRLSGPEALPAGGKGDLIDRRIAALADAADHLRATYAFMSSVIEGLPDATLVADGRGRVVLANQAALQYFGRSQDDAPAGHPLASWLAALQPLHMPVLPGLGEDGGLRPESGIECRDPAGRALLFRCAPCAADGAEAEPLWIVSLADVTPLREAERKRDETLRFLSHDMRSPQAAIIALLDQHAAAPGDLPGDELLARIRRHAGRTRELAEAFVQFARAESVPLRRDAIDLVDVVFDAIDDCWALARARRIVLAHEVPEDAAETEGDRGMLTRALINLLNNAIKFSPDGGTVQCTLRPEPEGWTIRVQDQGPGIDPAQQRKLFERFSTMADAQPAHAGIGLGLAFVKLAAQRHGGQVGVDSQPGAGAVFHLTLPRAGA